MPKSTFANTRFAVFPRRCLLQYGLHCFRTRYLYLYSPAFRAMQKPSCNDTHLWMARLVAATRPVSQALSTVLRLSMIETRSQLDMFSEKGTANALPRPRLPI